MDLIQNISEGCILSVYKPLEWTSFDVVRKLKMLLRKDIANLKIGHAGTLDPLAEGLLIICTQKMTKQVESIQNMKKTYIARIFLGATRPSIDKETEIDAEFPTDHITEEALEFLLLSIHGKQLQTPPIYSAIKVEGKRVYLSARKGVDVLITPKEIEIFEIKLTSFKLPYIEIQATVSKGTYIRTIAKDIGLKLNSGAYLDHLVRTQVGEFSSANAYTIEAIENEINSNRRRI